MIEILEKLHEEVTGRLGRCESEQDVEEIRVDYLGRKGGRLTALLRGLRELPVEERPSAGAELNRRRGKSRPCSKRGSPSCAASGRARARVGPGST